MSRITSTVLLGSMVAAIAVLNAACTVQASASAKTKNRFVEDGVTVTADADWAGEPIKINADGVGIAVNGGLDVVVSSDPHAKITATARMLAMADAEDKASADQSILDAKGTFTITKSGDGWVVACSHGGSHGTSDSGSSGCEKLTVTIPAGMDTMPIDLTALSGNGDVNVDVSSATLKNLGVNGKGTITVRAPNTKGADVSVVAEQADDINCLLPKDFAADEVIIQTEAANIVNNFSDLKLDSTGKGTRGQAGTGLASVKLTSKEFAGTTGKITIGPQ